MKKIQVCSQLVRKKAKLKEMMKIIIHTSRDVDTVKDTEVMYCIVAGNLGFYSLKWMLPKLHMVTLIFSSNCLM